MLESLHSGIDFETAVNNAVDAGFAEADCSFDLEGSDAIAKLGIVAHHAFGVAASSVKTIAEPLTARTAEWVHRSGKRHYQWASLEWVGQDLLGMVDLLPEDVIPGDFRVPGEWNCARIENKNGQVHTVQGRGAGGHPTAQAMLADILALVADRILKS
ncbi:hypothetical protein [Qipengyuania qiaonensis]|uniref:hypothetical protein n=1 Tax=Qipengyuania qiaonensis TaxID=2867240 RepID=UPI003CD0DE10